MRTETTIGTLLTHLRRRQRLLNSVRWLAHGTLVGAACGCATAVAVWAAGAGGMGSQALAAVVCTGAGALIGAVIGAALRIEDLHLARALDRAASAEDRFASALQLCDHQRRDRARLVVDDALGRVSGTPTAAALPVAMPRSARWLPIPILALAALLALLPAASQLATAAPDPEITVDEWSSINKEFAKELARLPKAATPEDEELQKQLQRLAEMLKQNPEKKDALKEIARLSEKVAERRRTAGTRQASMKSAARAVASSAALKDFASKLKEGAYEPAASELKKLSEQLKNGELSPDASEFESIAADLQRLSEQADEEQELSKECQNCSNAASKMNRDQLAEAMRRLSEQLKKNSKRLSECDNLSECDSLLEQLKRMMNQCQSCKKPGQGEGECEGEGGGRGGLKAGWGTAAKWNGGSLKQANEQRAPKLEDPQERAGRSTTFQIVSPDERAKTGRRYEELYADFVHKTEADLDLESVPAAYREYLKRYFNSIRPVETAPAGAPADRPGETDKPNP